MSQLETKPGEKGDRRRRFDPEVAQRIEKLFDRLPPHSLEAEMSLLGSMLLDPGAVGDVVSVVRRPEDFFNAAHSEIFRAIIDVYDKHHSGDLVQIIELLRDKAQLEAIGGPDYLAELAESVPSAVNAPHYARIVAEKSKLRRLIDAAGSILYDAFHTGELGPDGVREVLDKAEMAVFDIAQEANVSDPQKLAELLQTELDRLEAAEGKGITGVKTGFGDLDDLLSGMQPGEMLVIAARPSMGKTALALNMAEQIAFGGSPARTAPPDARRVPVGVFSLEMSKSAVTQRLLSAASGVDSHKLRGGAFSKGEYESLLNVAGLLSEASLYVDDMPNMTVLQLRARARRLVAQHGVQAIMIDYLQLLTAPGAARESRQVEVSTISRQLKALARELNVPVVCLSQLNRASEQREGNRPRMSDLRESGSIEQDADVVILLHREDYYHIQNPDWAAENQDKVGVAELIIAKQRNGPTGVVKLTWDAHTTRFKNYAGGYGGGDSGYGSYDTPSAAAGPSHSPPASRPASPPPFAPGKKSGPISNHRDGGGPDKNSGGEDYGEIPI